MTLSTIYNYTNCTLTFLFYYNYEDEDSKSPYHFRDIPSLKYYVFDPSPYNLIRFPNNYDNCQYDDYDPDEQNYWSITPSDIADKPLLMMFYKQDDPNRFSYAYFPDDTYGLISNTSPVFNDYFIRTIERMDPIDDNDVTKDYTDMVFPTSSKEGMYKIFDDGKDKDDDDDTEDDTDNTEDNNSSTNKTFYRIVAVMIFVFIFVIVCVIAYVIYKKHKKQKDEI